MTFDEMFDECAQSTLSKVAEDRTAADGCVDCFSREITESITDQIDPVYDRFGLFDISEDMMKSTRTIVEENKALPNDPESSTTLLQKLSSKFQKPTAGADVMALRGIYGADFEGYALVRPLANNKRNLASLLGKVNAPKERFLLIKGPFCFVFKDELSPAPKYVIRLAHTRTRMVSTGDDLEDKRTVAMEISNNEGDLEYEFLLSEYALGFCAVANQMALQGETKEMQRKLGDTHHLLHQTVLLRYAERIAVEKLDTTPTILNLAGRRLPKRKRSYSHAA